MKLKRLVIGLALSLVLIPVIGWIILTLSVKKFSDPDFLVAQIEQSLNCRAEIKAAELDLYGKPASLSLTGIAFGPRDEFVTDGVPQSERPPLNPSVSVDYVHLQLETMPLFSQQLVVRNLEIERPQLDLRIYEDGTTSLDELLADVRGKKDSSAPKPEGEQPAPSKSKKFTADDLGLSAVADRFAIDDMTIYATIEKSKITIQIYDVDLIATNIDVDPSDLEHHNSIELDYNATIAADSFAQNFRFIDMVIDGKGTLRPFELDTRELHPFLDTQVTVAKDSYIDGLVVLDELEGAVRELEKFGVKFEEGDLRLRGDFSEETTASFTAHRGRVRMTDDLQIPIGPNIVILRQNSWVDSGANDHEFFLTFILGSTLTKRIDTELEKFLVEAFGPELAKKFKNMILEPVTEQHPVTGEDFFVLNLNSSGKLGEPDVDLDALGQIDAGGLLKDLLKGEPAAAGHPASTEDTLKGLLDGLLNPGNGAGSAPGAKTPEPKAGEEDPLKDLEGQARKLLDGLLKPAAEPDDQKKPEADGPEPPKDVEDEAKKLLNRLLKPSTEEADQN